VSEAKAEASKQDEKGKTKEESARANIPRKHWN
jgi:hypothetical protein